MNLPFLGFHFNSANIGLSVSENIRQIAVDNQVHIDLGGGVKFIAVRSQVYRKIQQLIANGDEYNTVKFAAECIDGSWKEIIVTDDVWETSLIGGPWADDFRRLLPANYESLCEKRSNAIEELMNVPGFVDSAVRWFKDMHASLDTSDLPTKRAAQERLERTPRYLLGNTYFTPTMLDMIWNIPTSKGNLGNSLRKLEEKFALNDMILCTCCYFLPLYSSLFERALVNNMEV